MHIDQYLQDGDYVDKDGCHWSDAESFIQGSLLGFCCCGAPRKSLGFVRDVLRHVKNSRDVPYEQWLEDGRKVGDERVMYFAYYVLDEKGFLDHGGSVPGWITSDGEDLLDDLDELLGARETANGV